MVRIIAYFNINFRTRPSCCLIKKKSPFLTISGLWLPKLYDLRKKYEQELEEMYLIINGMDDDLRQMMTIEKG